MNREAVARAIFAATPAYRHCQWGQLPAEHAACLAMADAALSALKGPRTGEELYNAELLAIKNSTDPGYRFVPWTQLSSGVQQAYGVVAATFHDPEEIAGYSYAWQALGEWLCGDTTADVPVDMRTELAKWREDYTPPIPAGWPDSHIPDSSQALDGRWLCAIRNADDIVIAGVYGTTRDEADSRARLVAWTLANQRPVGASHDQSHKQGWDEALAAVLECLAGGEPEALPAEVAGAIADHYERAHADGVAAEKATSARLTAALWGVKKWVPIKIHADIMDGLSLPPDAPTAEAVANLASHLTQATIKTLLRALLDSVADHKVTPDEWDAARQSPSALAALLLRVRGPVEVAF